MKSISIVRPETSVLQIFTIVLIATMLALPAIVRAKVGIGDSPKIEFTTVSGVKVDKQYLKGKLVIVDFWASWCRPCVEIIPRMKELNSEYGSQDIKVLGVNSDRSKETMLKFVADKELNWLQYYDQGSKLGNLWGIPGIPTLFLLSPQGKVLWTGNPSHLNWPLAKALKEYFNKELMLENLKKKNIKALVVADKSLEVADFPKMISEFRNMDTGAVEDEVIFTICESLFNRIKMIQDKGREKKIQDAIKADKEGGRAFVDMMVVIDEAMRVKGAEKKGEK